MSECKEERSEDVVGRGDDEGGGGGFCRRGGGDNRKKTKERGHVCGGGDRRKAKSSILFRFGKVEKQVPRRNKRAANPSSSPGCFGRGVGGGAAAPAGGGGCCRCFKQTPTVGSPVESQTSDPNSPEFTYELLRALIEKNDFYSKECNPHLDIGDNSGN